MPSESIIKNICELPVKFLYGEKSAAELVKETGISNKESLLTVEAVEKYLSDNASLIQQWLNWSADKRTKSGWYFKPGLNCFVVGNHPDGELKSYQNEVSACAEFIIQELQSIRRA